MVNTGTFMGGERKSLRYAVSSYPMSRCTSMAHPGGTIPAIRLMLDNIHTGEIRIIGQVNEVKKGFAANLEEETRKNTDFRRVLYTGKYSQLVLMCLRPMEDIGEETHDDVDQFFRFEEGEGVVVIDGVKNVVKDGSGVIVPSGAKHNVVNTSKSKNLRLYTIYSPPEHQDKVVRKTKQEALAREEHYNGKPTEK